jgi:hypothetical protein
MANRTLAELLGDPIPASPLDISGGLLTDNAGPFSRTERPQLFRDSAGIPGANTTAQDIIGQWAQRDPANYQWFLQNLLGGGKQGI